MITYLKNTQPDCLLSIRVPFPKSLRQNGEVPDSYRKQVMVACRGLRLPPDQELSVSADFHGKWKDSKNKLRRRDHVNYVAVLIDVLCECLGTDDSTVVHWKDLWKVHKPNPPEYIVLTVRRSKMR